MKKLILTTICLLLSHYFMFAQTNRYSCDILGSAVSNTEFTKYFQVNQSNADFEIVDTNLYFRRCDLGRYSNKKFATTEVYPMNVDVNKGTDVSNKYKIILYNLKRKGRTYTLSFWRPYTNTNLILSVKHKKKHNIVKLIQMSVF